MNSVLTASLIGTLLMRQSQGLLKILLVSVVSLAEFNADHDVKSNQNSIMFPVCRSAVLGVWPGGGGHLHQLH